MFTRLVRTLDAVRTAVLFVLAVVFVAGFIVFGVWHPGGLGGASRTRAASTDNAGPITTTGLPFANVARVPLRHGKVSFASDGDLRCTASARHVACAVTPRVPKRGGLVTIPSMEMSRDGTARFASYDVRTHNAKELGGFHPDFTLRVGQIRAFGGFVCASQSRWYRRAHEPDPLSRFPVVFCYSSASGSSFVIGRAFHSSF